MSVTKAPSTWLHTALHLTVGSVAWVFIAPLNVSQRDASFFTRVVAETSLTPPLQVVNSYFACLCCRWISLTLHDLFVSTLLLVILSTPITGSTSL